MALFGTQCSSTSKTCKISCSKIVLNLFLILAAHQVSLSNAAAPAITLASPSGTKGYFSDFNIHLTFDQTVTAVTTSAQIELKDNSNSVKFTKNCASSMIMDSTAGTGRSALVYATGISGTNLAKNVQHTVKVAANCFKNAAGEGNSEFTATWTTANVEPAEETELPSVLLTTPVDGSYSSTLQSFDFYFSEKVKVGFGNLTVIPGLPNGTDETAITFPVSDTSKVAVSDDKVTVTGFTVLSGRDYKFTIPLGAFLDKNDNAMAAHTGYNAIKATRLKKVTIGQTADGENVVDVTGRTTAFTLPAGRNVTTATNLVLEFEEEVTAQSGASNKVEFCTSWLATAGTGMCTSPALSFVANTKALFPPSGEQSKTVVLAAPGFTGGTTYSLQLTQGAFGYVDKLPFTSTVNFTVDGSTYHDLAKPAVKAVWPVNGSAEEAASVAVKLYFGEQVQAGNNEAVQFVPETVPGVTLATISVVGRTFASGTQVTIDPTDGDVKLGVEYTVKVPAGAVKDAKNNDLDEVWTKFTTKTVRSGTLQPGASTEAGATYGNAVPVTSTLYIPFSSASVVRRGTGNLVLNCTDALGTGASTITQIPVTDADQVVIQDNAVLVVPANALTAYAKCHVSVAKGVFMHTDAFEYWFTTLNVDTVAPKLTGIKCKSALYTTEVACTGNTYLVDTQSATSADNKIVLYFDQPVYPGTANYVITLSNGSYTHCYYPLDAGSDGTSDAANSVCEYNAGKVAGLNTRALTLSTKGSGQNGALTAGTWTLTVPQNALADAAQETGRSGGKINLDQNYSFTVQLNSDVTPPALAATSPFQYVACEPKWPYQTLAGDATTTSRGNGLAWGTDCVKTVAADISSAFDAVTGIYTDANARLPLKTTELVLNFAENVQKATSGAIKVVNCGTDHACNTGSNTAANADLMTFDVTDNNIEIDGKKVTIYLYKPLDYDASDANPGYKYFLQIADAALLDAAGNGITGFSGSGVTTDAATKLKFTVDSLAPKKSPSVTEYGAGSVKLLVRKTDITSAVGATKVSMKENLLLEFSEPVERVGTSNVFTLSKSGSFGSPTAEFGFTTPSASAAGAYISYNGTKVVLVSGDTGEAVGTAAGTDYALRVGADAVKDRSSGNKNAQTDFGTPGTAGANGNLEVVAAGSDDAKPVVLLSYPEDGQVGVATDTTLTLVFSEKVVKQNLASGITITKCQGTHYTLPLSSCSADGSVVAKNTNSDGTVVDAGVYTLSNADLGGALTAGKTYKITIAAASFKDTSTKAGTCASGCPIEETVIYFTVGMASTDSTVPQLQTSTSAVTPTVNSAGTTLTAYAAGGILSASDSAAALKPTLKLAFGEQVQPKLAAGTLKVKKCQQALSGTDFANCNSADDALALTLNAGNTGYPFGSLTTKATADKVYFYGKNVFVTANSKLSSARFETEKFLDISADAIRDAAGNSMAAYGASSSGVLNFKSRELSDPATPGTTQKPVPTLLACDLFDSAVGHNSGTGATEGLARNAKITCYTSEPVYLDASAASVLAKFCAANNGAADGTNCGTGDDTVADVEVAADGLSVSFTPTNAGLLSHNKVYWIKWTAGFVKNSFGYGVLAQGGSANTFVFKTINDDDTPTVSVAVSPTGSANVADANSMIMLTFSDGSNSFPMVPATAAAEKAITLVNCGADNNCGAGTGVNADTTVETVYVNNTDTDKIALDSEGKKVWLRPASAFTVGQKYKVTVAASAYADSAGKALSETSLEFTVRSTQDLEKPSIFMVGPVEKDAYGMVSNKFPTVKVYFTEAVKLGTGSKKFTLAATANLEKQASALSWTKASNGIAEISTGFTSSSPTTGGYSYTLEVEAQAVKDLNDNEIAAQTGVVVGTVGQFADTGASNPTATLTPADGTTSVSTRPVLKLRMSAAVVAAAAGSNNYLKLKSKALGASSFSDAQNLNLADATKVKILSAGANAGTVTTAGYVDVLVYPAALTSQTEYAVQVGTATLTQMSRTATPGAFAGIADDTTWNFVTIDVATRSADVAPPAISSTVPGHGALNTQRGAEIKVTFNEKIVLGGGVINLRNCGTAPTATCASGDGVTAIQSSCAVDSVDEKILRCFPTSGQMAYGNLYSLEFTAAAGSSPAIKDKSNNVPMKATDHTTGLQFTVEAQDTTAAAVRLITPKASATNVPTSVRPSIYFSEKVIYDGTSSLAFSPAISSSSLTVSGAKVEVTPGVQLTKNQAYTIAAASTSMFKDVAGTSLASTNLGLSFTTANPTMGAVANWNATKAKLDGFTAREGHTTVALSNGTILVFGGADTVRAADTGCKTEVMSSSATDLKLWSKFTPTGLPAKCCTPKVQVLKDDTVFYLAQGPTCGAPALYKSTDAGLSFTKLTDLTRKPTIAADGSHQEPKAFPPAQLEGASLVALGGWQLFVLGGGMDAVWRCEDQGCTVWQELLLPTASFGKRFHQHALSTPENELIVIGGSADAANTGYPAPSTLFNDVWRSTNLGATWTLLTANLGSDVPARRGAASATAADGTVLLLGGEAFNTTAALKGGLRMTTDGVAADTVPPFVLGSNLTGGVGRDSPTSVGKDQMTGIELYFSEDLVLYSNTGTETAPTIDVVGGGATLFSVPVDNSKPNSPTVAGRTGGGTVKVSGAKLTLALDVNAIYKFTAHTDYSITIQAGIVKDAAKNANDHSMGLTRFHIAQDTTGPVAASTDPTFPASAATNVAPRSLLRLRLKDAATPLVADAAKEVRLECASAGACAPGTEKNISAGAFLQLPGPLDAGVATSDLIVDPGMALTNGAEYKVTVPAGAFKDAYANLIAELTWSFTVLSGTEGRDFASLAQDGFEALTDVFTGAGTGNLTADTAALAHTSALALQSAYPVKGTADALAGKVSLKLKFNEPLVLNASGKINVYNSSLVKVGSIEWGQPAAAEKTHQAVTDSNGTANATTTTTAAPASLAPAEVHIGADNSTLIELSALMTEAGMIYHLEIPAGTFKGLDGGDYAGLATADWSVATLAGSSDTVAPVVIASSPGASRSDVETTTTEALLVFSEPVVANVDTGLARRLGEEQAVALAFNGITYTPAGMAAVAVPAANCSIQTEGSGIPEATLRIVLGEALLALHDKELAFTIPSVVKDAAGNALNNTALSYGFTPTVALDTTAPTLSTIWPSTEGTVGSFARATGTKIALTFSEDMKVGAEGSLTLIGKYNSGNLSFAPSSLALIGKRTFIIDPTLLAAGEEYSLTIDAGALTDLAGNAYVPTTAETAWKLSTAPVVKFAADFALAAKKTNASAVFVDGCSPTGCTSTLVVVSGSNGTLAMEDVEQTATYIPATCAAAYSPFTGCETTPCAADATATRTLKVWRPASADGQVCSGNVNDLDVTVPNPVLPLSQSCVCPRCLTPPAASALPEHSDKNDTSYLDAYTQVEATTGRTLKCAEGFHPSGLITCAVDNARASLYGIFLEADFPSCLPNECPTAPPAVPNQAPMETCLDVGVNGTVKPDNSTCAMKCAAGYAPKDGIAEFRCLRGEWVLPECAPQTCAAKTPEVAGGAVECDSLALGGSCELSCELGHKLEGVASTKCELAAGSTAPEAAPSFSKKFGSCAKMDCGAAKAPENAEVKTPAGSTLLGGEATLACKAGYEPVSGQSDTKLTCAATETGEVAWASELACQPITCPAEKPTVENGKLADCNGEKRFGQKCALTCDAGYELVAGDGNVECGADKTWKSGGKCEVTTQCAAPVLGEHMTTTTCAEGEKVLSDGTCAVTCAAGYKATGDFVCHHGEYTSVPICAKAGSDVAAKTFVKGSLVLSLNTAGKTAAQLEEDPAFKAAAGQAVAKAIKREASEVEITKVRAAERRLQSGAVLRGAPRRMEGEDTLALVLEYRVEVADAAAAAALQKDLAEIPQDQFSKDFTAALEKSYEGVTVASLEVAPTQTVVEYTVTPKKSLQVKDSDSGPSAAVIGGIFGAIGGVALLVGLACVLKKKGKSADGNMEAGNSNQA